MSKMEWISIEDRLPHHGQRCLIYTWCEHDIYWHIGQAHYIYNNRWDIRGLGRREDRLKYWMPMETPPGLNDNFSLKGALVRAGLLDEYTAEFGKPECKPRPKIKTIDAPECPSYVSVQVIDGRKVITRLDDGYYWYGDTIMRYESIETILKSGMKLDDDTKHIWYTVHFMGTEHDGRLIELDPDELGEPIPSNNNLQGMRLNQKGTPHDE